MVRVRTVHNDTGTVTVIAQVHRVDRGQLSELLVVAAHALVAEQPAAAVTAAIAVAVIVGGGAVMQTEIFADKAWIVVSGVAVGSVVQSRRGLFK